MRTALRHLWQWGLICLLALTSCQIASSPPIARSTPTPTAVHNPPTPDLRDRSRADASFRLAIHTLILDTQVAALASQAGFDTAIQVFPWRDINLRPGYYEWGMADAMVRTAQEYNLDIVVRLDMPPYWAQRTDPHALPFELPTYLEFVTVTAARYQGIVLGYIVWNEPNLAEEWGGWVAPPADYAAVLCQAHARLRAADPGALVIAAGLAPTNEISERALDDREFLKALLHTEAAGCFDVLAAHDYGYGLPPEDPHDAHTGLNLARLIDLHTLLAENGLTQPVWITELGYTLQPGLHPDVTPEQQAAYLQGAFARVRREWPWVTLFGVWNLSYTGDAEMQGFSLIEADLTPRPALAIIPELRQAIMREP